MKPTIGRIVHYRCTENAAVIKSAIITAVHSETCVSLIVFGNDSLNPAWATSVMQGDGAGQWNWPAREE